jgi:hypothetical protein
MLECAFFGLFCRRIPCGGSLSRYTIQNLTLPSYQQKRNSSASSPACNAPEIASLRYRHLGRAYSETTDQKKRRKWHQIKACPGYFGVLDHKATMSQGPVSTSWQQKGADLGLF